MQMKNNLMLALLFLAGAVSVHAQVKIGDALPPASGATLDLNGAYKGGFVLPNVHLSEVNSLAGFTDAASLTGDTEKAALRGALVYNMNDGDNFDVGIYYWDGAQWLPLTVTAIPPTSPGFRTVWKILWEIIPTIDATVDGTHYYSQMTPDEIERVKEKAVWFEEFVEQHTNNKVDIQITVDVAQNPVTGLEVRDGNIWNLPLQKADMFRLKPENNFDATLFSADFTGLPHSWMGVFKE
ncbi:hypothetical protein FACS189421_14640 [Bacteroidia bacterium]|nr:hypothetical protein FACS189421_14640 [Bacteroidia bacterium]